jgi:hypothetical protein
MDAVLSFVSTHPLFVVGASLALIVVIYTYIMVALSLGPIPAQEVEFLKAADAQTKERMWDHAAHENVVFNDRLNFFLLFESISLGVIGALYTRVPADNTPLQYLALLGLLISLLWLYVQARQKYVLNSVRARNAIALPEYAFILRNRRQWWPSTTWLLGYLLPLLVLLIWLVVLAIVDGVLLRF